MSDGELCGSRVWVSMHGGNTLAGEWARCGRYVGHDGKHEKSLKCVRTETRGGQEVFINYSVGSVSWDDALADKRPTAPKRS